MKKERKSLRDFAKSNDYFADPDGSNKIKNIEDVERICEAFKLLELQDMNKKIKESPLDGKQIIQDYVDVMEKQLEQQRETEKNSYINNIGKNTATPLSNLSKKSLWGNENVQLLIKAVSQFPAGTNQRWEKIADFLNRHASNLPENVSFNSKDVLNKAKDIQSSDFTKNDLKSQVNQKAFESFEKNKKELRVLDNSEISTKDVSDIKKQTQKVSQPDETETQVIKEPAVVEPKTAVEPKTWSTEEQTLLENMMRKFPLSTADRWDRIAECIPNRTKKECLKRVKELVDLVNARKGAQRIN